MNEGRDTGIPVSPPWDDLDDETQDSAAQGVMGIIRGDDPAQSHRNWLDFKIEHGWVFGDVKDEVAKTHPCIVPYNELPDEQQIKDKLFHAIVNALFTY